MKKDKVDEQFKYFLDLLKILHIIVVFVKAFTNMRKYTKFLKDLLINK